MKRRVGFVSNSSSCSFVVLGYKIPKNYNIITKIVKVLYPEKFTEYVKKYGDRFTDIDELSREFILDNDIFELLDNDECGYDSDDFMVIGETIMEGDEIETDEIEIDISEYKPYKNIVKVLDDQNIDYKKILLTGIKMC